MDETTRTDTGDDYSYDLAHDLPTTGQQQVPGRQRRRGSPSTETPPDEVGDYSYDLAHEVPPARRHGA